MDGFSEIKQDLNDQGVSFVAASADPQDKAAEMAEKTGLAVGYGVDQAQIESLGGYWEERRGITQPSEFVIDPEGKIVQVSYSDGPLARTEAGDAAKFIAFQKSQRA